MYLFVETILVLLILIIGALSKVPPSENFDCRRIFYVNEGTLRKLTERDALGTKMESWLLYDVNKREVSTM